MRETIAFLSMVTSVLVLGGCSKGNSNNSWELRIPNVTQTKHKIDTREDRFEKMKIHHLDIQLPKKEHLHLQVFEETDKKCATNNVMMQFFGNGGELTDEIVFLVNDERIAAERNRNGTQTMKLDLFLKIANGTKVEGRCDKSEFELAQPERDAIFQLLRQLPTGLTTNSVFEIIHDK